MTFAEFSHSLPSGTKKDSLLRGLLMAALLGVLLWELSAARAFIVPVCLSALLAFLMNPLVRFFCRHRVPHWLSITLSASLLALLLISMLTFLVYETRALIIGLPSIVSGLNGKLVLLSKSPLFHRLHLPGTMSEVLERVTSGTGHGMPALLNGVEGIVKTGSVLVIVLMFSVVMLATREHLRRSAERILTRAENIRGPQILDQVIALIEKFLYARLIIIAVIAAASVLVLRLFGLSYSFVLGPFIGIMTLLPEIGFVISLIPVVIVAFATAHSLLSTVLLVGVLFVVHTLEGYLLTPKLLGKRLDINALATFLGVFAGGLLWGVAGMFLSVLILGVLRIIMSAVPSLEGWGELLAQPERKGKRVFFEKTKAAA